MTDSSTPSNVHGPRILAEVVMYRTRFCPYCIRAEALLRSKGVHVREVDVSNDPGKRRWLVDATRRRTVPQIFINGVSVGGFDEIASLDGRGILDQLLAEGPPGAVSAP